VNANRNSHEGANSVDFALEIRRRHHEKRIFFQVRDVQSNGRHHESQQVKIETVVKDDHVEDVHEQEEGKEVPSFELSAVGAFAAAGAQIAATAAGAQSFKDMAQNIFLQISLDSFVPIPVSRMPPLEMPLEFVLDSIAPSLARPILEFALNKNGLGQDIYNDQNRRFGDAYTGGDKIPEMYKEASRYMVDATRGEIDISPNTLYFLSNSFS
jgi:hypothetical protein